MGRSLRRHKKHKPLILRKGHKKKHVKTKVPLEVTSGLADLQEKLPTQ